MIGGTPTVITATQPVQTIVYTSDGVLLTRYATPAPLIYTTTVGGIEVTEVLVTTPTGGSPITLTFVSTSGGTLETLTSTFSPTTLTTTKPETITRTSTPSQSLSFSTRPKSTATYTSTSSVSANPTAGNPSKPSVTTTTRVFSWDEADLFLGTFLPTMLAVIIVIPLRIIDLNVKLYQPFQTLTSPGGVVGSESMTLEYTGLMGFVTPVITLMQGRPVPFVTTVLVGLSSILIPLSAEAIGLKLHGTCNLNTGTDTCGISLGVSPVPANVLIGLLALLVLLLILLLVFLRKWTTGVHANPWNIAGMASLAGNSAARVGQISEKTMRRAVSQKQYVLGQFEDEQGQQQYGITLADESGHGLHDANEDNDSDGTSFEGFDTASDLVKGSGKYLPFMPLRYPWRIIFTLYLAGLFIFILIYQFTKFNDSRLWKLMNVYAFGTRFVFAAFGVVIAFGWQAFFLSEYT